MSRSGPLLTGVFLFVAQAAMPQGMPVGPQFRVNTYTTDAQGLSSVATDPSGNFVVVWSSRLQDGSSAGIFGQRFASMGAPLGAEFQVNTYTPSEQRAPSVASDSSGNFVVVWSSLSQDGSLYGVFGQRYASSGIPLGPEFRVNTYTTFPQSGPSGPSVTSDSSGNFTVVWESYGQDGSEYGVHGQRYSGSGVPLGAEFRVNTYTTSYQRLPSVSSDASGNFVVVWQSYTEDGSGYGIYGQRYDSSGTPLGPEFRVNTDTTSSQSGPSVASDSSGNFVVVWQSNAQDGSNYGVFGQRYDSSGTPLGPEFRVNTYTTLAQVLPSVTTDPSGNFVVVWQSYTQDGSNWGVFGQRYDSAGSPHGPEFRVNTETANPQGQPSVATDPSGNFVVAWTGQEPQDPDFGVFGQRYGRIVPVELLRFGVD